MPNDAHDGRNCVITYLTGDGASRVRVWNDSANPAPRTIRTSDGRTASARSFEAIQPGMLPLPDDLRLAWPGLDDVLALAEERWEQLSANDRLRFGDEFLLYAGDALYQAERDGVPPVIIDERIDA